MGAYRDWRFSIDPIDHCTKYHFMEGCSRGWAGLLSDGTSTPPPHSDYDPEQINAKLVNVFIHSTKISSFEVGNKLVH